MRGKKHSDEIKATVIAALLTGQGVNEVAREYNLDRSIVSRWKKGIPEGELQQLATHKKENIGELVENHLRASLIACAKVAEQTNNERWLSRQSGDSLAVFYGVLSDKSIRLLEAAQRAQEKQAEAQNV
jgi:transposase-like protein